MDIAKSTLLILTVFLTTCMNGIHADYGDKDPINVLLIAGPNDHCSDNSKPCHKYIQDMQVIRDCLQQSQEVEVNVQLLIAERPKPGSMDNIDVVVVHTGGDRTIHEWHGIFPQNLRPEDYDDPDYQKFLIDFANQIDRGMGLVILHYSTWVDHPVAREYYAKWIGGYYKDGESKVDGDPDTPGTTAVEEVIPNPDHPVLNGVSPWKSVAEYYYWIHLDQAVVPLLRSPLPLNDPKPETVAWALEREDGGRGIGFTGCHNHENMYIEDFRKFVLNAVVWTSGASVPANGIQSEVSKKYFK